MPAEERLTVRLTAEHVRSSGLLGAISMVHNATANAERRPAPAWVSALEKLNEAHRPAADAKADGGGALLGLNNEPLQASPTALLIDVSDLGARMSEDELLRHVSEFMKTVPPVPGAFSSPSGSWLTDQVPPSVLNAALQGRSRAGKGKGAGGKITKNGARALWDYQQAKYKKKYASATRPGRAGRRLQQARRVKLGLAAHSRMDGTPPLGGGYTATWWRLLSHHTCAAFLRLTGQPYVC